jgi:hypothetical protein
VKGVRAEKVRVEANRCNPVRDQPGVLPGGRAAAVITTAAEQKFARFLASGFDIIIDGLPRLLRQLKPDRSSSTTNYAGSGDGRHPERVRR